MITEVDWGAGCFYTITDHIMCGNVGSGEEPHCFNPVPVRYWEGGGEWV